MNQRDIRDRLADHLKTTLPQVAALLGEGWEAGPCHLVSPEGRHFLVELTLWPDPSPEIRILPQGTGLSDPPSLSAQATRRPEALARALLEDLLPRCPPPPPRVAVYLSEAGARATEYLEADTLADLPADLADAARRLLAGGRWSEETGLTYLASLDFAAARLLLADWHEALHRAELTPDQRLALEHDVQRLQRRLELLDGIAEPASGAPGGA